MSWWDEVPPEQRQEGDLQARMPAVYEAMTGTPWADADEGDRSRAGTVLVRLLAVADAHDPARYRLVVAQEALSRVAQVLADAGDAVR